MQSDIRDYGKLPSTEEPAADALEDVSATGATAKKRLLEGLRVARRVRYLPLGFEARATVMATAARVAIVAAATTTWAMVAIAATAAATAGRLTMAATAMATAAIFTTTIMMMATAVMVAIAHW